MARIIRGLMTTSTPDRALDTIDPAGGQWTLPVPLLIGHQHPQVVGKVTKIERKGNGLEATCELIPGHESHLAQHAFATVKHRAVTGFSIGFTPIDGKANDKGGINYSKWRLNELSLVAVPCNDQARITVVQDDEPPVLPAQVVTPALPAPSTAKPSSAKTSKPRANITVHAGRYAGVAAEKKRLEGAARLQFDALLCPSLTPAQRVKLDKAYSETTARLRALTGGK